MLIVVVLLVTVLLRFTLIAATVYLLLPCARTCPRCADELVRIEHRWLRWLVPMLEHRWCLRCGWSGLVRRRPRIHGETQSRVMTRVARS